MSLPNRNLYAFTNTPLDDPDTTGIEKAFNIVKNTTGRVFKLNTDIEKDENNNITLKKKKPKLVPNEDTQ